MKHLVFIVIVLAVFTHCTEGRQPAPRDKVKRADSDTTSAPGGKMDRVTPINSGVQRAYVDPGTGEFVAPPEIDSPATHTPTRPPALSSSSILMEERSSPVPGGGKMIDLKGRFHNPFSATVESDGKINIRHPVGDKKE